jgi:hypothetical protein
MNDRLMIAAMAMQGMLASPDCIGDAQAVSGDAIECADALLAAAGGNDDPLHRGDMGDNLREWIETAQRYAKSCDDLKARAEAAESKLAACERERDALKAEVAMRERQVVDFSARVADDDRVFKKEIAALKRRLEPLTLQEGGGVNNPIIYGSRPLAWDEITAIVADADRIRERRQP